MGRKEKEEEKEKEKEKAEEAKQKIHQVLRLLRNHGTLTLKQEKFCSDACVSRFLNAKGGNVKKAAKQLRSCLAWRDGIAIDQLMADEFAAEISEGAAYVAGIDDEARPVLVIRLKQDYQKLHSQKLYIRLLVFTVEVAIALMPRGVQQFVLLLDAGGGFRSASACFNIVVSTFNVLGENYPGRLLRAFIIDPPSLFCYLWKGFRPFLDSPSAVSVISSLVARTAAAAAEDARDPAFSFPRTASHRYDTTPRLGSSFRFTFAVPPHDPLKPWHLTLAEPNNERGSDKGGKVAQPWCVDRAGKDNGFEQRSLSPLLVSPLNARSFSFASSAARTPRSRPTPDRLSMPSTPWSGRSRAPSSSSPSPFLAVPAIFRRDSGGRSERSVDAFRRWAHFYWAPYDEMSYRAKMRPPLGGLVSIVSPHLNRRRVAPHLK